MLFLVGLLFSAFGAAEEPADPVGPVELSSTQLDQVTAGDLTLPNGKKLMDGFDNAAPGDFHPTLMMGVGNEGPWQAHFNSHKIVCADCP